MPVARPGLDLGQLRRLGLRDEAPGEGSGLAGMAWWLGGAACVVLPVGRRSVAVAEVHGPVHLAPGLLSGLAYLGRDVAAFLDEPGVDRRVGSVWRKHVETVLPRGCLLAPIAVLGPVAECTGPARAGRFQVRWEFVSLLRWDWNVRVVFYPGGAGVRGASQRVARRPHPESVG